MDRLDWDSTTVLGQYFLFAMALQTALMEVTWHGHRGSGIMIFILFCLLSVLFSYQCFNEKRKTLSVSGTVTFLFFQVRLSFSHGYCSDVILQFSRKAHNYISKGKKQQ